jgi:hypothetical protein
MSRCLCVALLVVMSSAHAGDSVLLPRDTPVAGKTQEQWSREWWQWAASFDRNASPVADETGALCASGQSGKVWFLAGTYGTGRTIRTCTVPRGKYLFFPLVNYVVSSRVDAPDACERLAFTAARATDGVAKLVLDVDGHRYDGLVQHRLPTSECFDLGARSAVAASAHPTAADGYYVMLKPLPPGRHEINFGGILPTLLQAVTYTLIVE